MFQSATFEVWYLPITQVDPAGGTITLAAADIPVGMTGELYILQGTSRSVQLQQGRGPEGTYSFDVWVTESDTAPFTAGDPPRTGTPLKVEILNLLTQGFDLVSPLPGFVSGASERTTLLLFGDHLADGVTTQGRTVQLHGPSGEQLLAVQAALKSDENNPLCQSGEAKAFLPAYVVLAFYYQSEDLTPEAAIEAMLASMEETEIQQRLELSDLLAAVSRAGATYLVPGRTFVLQMNHLRQWTASATKGSVPGSDIGEFVLQGITAVRLRAAAAGESIDELDPANWEAQYTYRQGGFLAD